MLILKTTKAVQTSLHDDSTNQIEFRYRYSRDSNGLDIKCDAYRIVEDSTELIAGGGSYRKIGIDDLSELIQGATAITAPNDNPLEYFDSLIASGIKIVILQEQLWKGQLSIEDFE